VPEQLADFFETTADIRGGESSQQMADWCREARLGNPLYLNPKAYKSQTDTSLT